MKYTKETPLIGRSIEWSPRGWKYLFTKDDGEYVDFHAIGGNVQKHTRYRKDIVIKNLNSGQSTFIENDYSIY